MNKFITLELIVLAILIAYPFFFRPLKHRLKYAKFCDNLEQIAQAFICALIFKAFVAEAMVIPTGSMADTLRGTHFNIQCENCDFDYHYGFTQINAQSPPLGQLPLTQSGNYSRFPTMCTMCGYVPSPKKLRRVSNGDKIIVNKSIYQFTEPKIWDTVVFKNPHNLLSIISNVSSAPLVIKWKSSTVMFISIASSKANLIIFKMNYG